VRWWHAAGALVVVAAAAATAVSVVEPPGEAATTSAPTSEPPAGTTLPAPTTTQAVISTTAAVFGGEGVVFARRGGADVLAGPAGPVIARLRRGIPLAATGWDGELITVVTPCDTTAFVRADEVRAMPPAPAQDPGIGFDLGEAIIVVDPGHGGPNIGARAPDGTPEKSVNLEIAHLVRDLLEAPRAIAADGGVLAGDDIVAAGRVLMTRVGKGSRGDYEAGLTYRAALANAANASVMVSIHNNAGADISVEVPGSDAYYQSSVPESRRLATLIVEELRRSLEAFDADWVGTDPVGAKSRLSEQDGNPQYYGLLRRATVPTVIAEGAYIVNPSEAALLATTEFKIAYAEGVYRAIVRFLESGDTGDAPSYDPVTWPGGAGSGDARQDCTLPEE
jgi:N-acetylmuramoyl-L-alanine amidase